MIPLIAKAGRNPLRQAPGRQARGRLTTSLALVVALTGLMLIPSTPASAADEKSVGSVKSVEGAAFVIS